MPAERRGERIKAEGSNEWLGGSSVFRWAPPITSKKSPRRVPTETLKDNRHQVEAQSESPEEDERPADTFRICQRIVKAKLANDGVFWGPGR